MVGDGHDQVHVVLDHQNAHAVPSDAQEQLAQLGRFLRIQTSGWLIEKKQLWLRRKCAGEFCPPLQPVGKTPSRRLRRLAKTKGVEN